MRAKNLMIVQGGGPTAVFNASLASAIREAKSSRGFAGLHGARYGALGLAKDDTIDLTELTGADLDLLRDTPGAALGSSRFKPTEEDLERELETLKRLEVHHLLFMGGNGTMRGANMFAKFCEERGYEANVMGVPKTVDNDLAETARCPGYASAARYVAQSTQELGLDLRSLPQPVTILETMGRSVGWLAGAAALARTPGCDAPQLIYVPEIPFVEAEFLATLDGVLAKKGWALVVVAEGLKKPDGGLVHELGDASQRDQLKRPITGGVSHYLSSVVAQNLKIRCRSEKPGLLGRSSMSHLVAQDREDAELVGRAGVQALLAGEMGKMITLQPLGAEEPTGMVPLDAVGGFERTVPQDWLDGGPLAVSDGFREYLAPLVGSLKHYAAEFASAAWAVGR